MEEVRLLYQLAENAFLKTDKESLRSGNALTRSGIVMLTGRLEGFLKDSVSEFIETINDFGINANMLPPQIACTEIEHFVEECQLLAERCDSGMLAKLLRGSATKFRPGLFSKTGGNPSPATVDSMLFKVGIYGIIERLSLADFGLSTIAIESHVDSKLRQKISDAVSPSVQASRSKNVIDDVVRAIEEKWTPRKKERPVGYVHLLNELLRKRNLIAHGEGLINVTTSELEDGIAGVSKLMLGIDSHLDAHLESIKKGYLSLYP